MFGLMVNMEKEKKKMEPALDASINGQRGPDRNISSISSVPLTNGDGMKTEHEISKSCYDPIANPIDDPLQGKQGVGKQVYDICESNFSRQEYGKEEY